MAGGREETGRTLSFDPDSDIFLSALITGAVTDEEDVEVADLAPLRDAIDIDSVETVIDAVRQNPGGSARLSFSFEGYLVTVTSDGTVELTRVP